MILDQSNGHLCNIYLYDLTTYDVVDIGDAADRQ